MRAEVDLVAKEIATTITATVLLVAGMGKLLQGPSAFTEKIEQYMSLLGVTGGGPYRARALQLVATTLPWLQVGLAAMLIQGVLRRQAAQLTAGMMALFVGLQFAVLLRGHRPECGCFGLLWRERIGPKTVVRDGAVLAMAWALAAGRERSGTNGPTTPLAAASPEADWRSAPSAADRPCRPPA